MPVEPSQDAATDRLPRRLTVYFLCSWALLAAHAATFTAAADYASPAIAAWTLATLASYGFLYLVPAMLLTLALAWPLARRSWPAGRGLVGAVAVLSVGLSQAVLFADGVIHRMYGFHVNGFVLDLLLTPGGVASLGAGVSTQATAVLIVAGLLALQAVLYVWLVPRCPAAGRFRLRWLALAVVLLAGGERLAYAYSYAANYRPILFASEHIPFYQPFTARKLAKQLGIREPLAERAGEGAAADASARSVKAGSLAYPLAPLDIRMPKRPPNIVWLAVESLRFDMLDPHIMPRTWDFSQDALRLEKHYSGGNLTQMGVFSMFYGLYGTYWFPMLDNRRAPVLMDVLQRENYQFGLYTSQRFTFPAFDKTIFVNLDKADLHERSGGAEAWQRDRLNVSDMLDFIDRRDRARPFMTYMFFESTHANYSFPPETAIAKPYIEDLNYLTADFAGDIARIKNRYINAANHVDQQIGRVIDHLREKKLLDDTIVIVLGDHGEEFMERSRWGHSAEFNRFQTGTPAVIRVPGVAPRVVKGITSHLDIPATLLPLLGVRNPAAELTQGFDLLDPAYRRAYAVAADWNRVAYIGEDYKLSFPVNATGAVKSEATDGDDWPLADAASAKAAVGPAMREMLAGLSRFTARGRTALVQGATGGRGQSGAETR